jgi:Arc/MetJ-type ribon-helix-helix transcriptional regulator
LNCGDDFGSVSDIDRHLQMAKSGDTFFMTVVLAKDVEDFLQAQVRSGVCANASEFVNNLVRSFRDQQQKSLTITPELEAWLLEAADKPVAPLTKADFAAISERTHSKFVGLNRH